MAKWNVSDKPAKVDLRTIDKPFGELNERTQKRLRKAAIRGWPIQWFNGATFEPCNPGFVRWSIYRLDPSLTPPKRRVVWIVNNVAFDTRREAVTAYPGSEPKAFKERKK